MLAGRSLRELMVFRPLGRLRRPSSMPQAAGGKVLIRVALYLLHFSRYALKINVCSCVDHSKKSLSKFHLNMFY